MSNFLKVLIFLFSLNLFAQKEKTSTLDQVDSIEALDQTTNVDNLNFQKKVAPPPIRYKDNIYLDNQIFTIFNLPYGTYAPTNHNLYLDYFSAVDQIPNRPAIFLLFGGGFVAGNRTQLYDEAKRFARKGYAVFTIDYRLLGNTDYSGSGIINLPVLCDNGQFNDMAWYWAMQDLNAAIKAIALHKNYYNIDPDKIFLFGSSAGAITALNLAYTTQQEVYNTFPGVNFSSYPFLGDLDNTTNALAKSQTYTILGVATKAGALTHDYVSANETTPAIMLHNPCDELVLYEDGDNGIGPALGEPNCQGDMYGSRYIYDKITNFSLTPVKLYTDCGTPIPFDDHGFGPNIETIFAENKVPPFFYNILNNNIQLSSIQPLGPTTYCINEFKCNNPINRLAEDSEKDKEQQNNFETLVKSMNSEIQDNIVIHPNPTKGTASLSLDLWQEEAITINLLGIRGTLIASETINVKNQNQKHTIDLSNVANGIYFVRIESSHGTYVRKLIKN